jgi:uncharacterized protein (DUF486 family)
MKKDPTRVLLTAFTLFYGVFGLARLYFVFCPAYVPSEFRMSWVGLAGNFIGFALCGFLLADAETKPTRLFWGIMMLESMLTIPFRIGAFWSLPGHGALISALQFIITAVITGCFLVAYARNRFSLFGKRSRSILKLKEEQNQ